MYRRGKTPAFFFIILTASADQHAKKIYTLEGGIESVAQFDANSLEEVFIFTRGRSVSGESRGSHLIKGADETLWGL